MKRRNILFALTIAVLIAVGLFVFSSSAKALRFQTRSMFISSSTADETAFYQISFRYPTANVVGSILLEFCDNPIPTIPCVLPEGMNIDNVELTDQTGEVGFSITQKTDKTLVLSRTPSVTGLTFSSYKLDNIKNPSKTTQDFYVRMTDYSSTDASGNFIDFGSVTGQLVRTIGVYAQVPPILIFCVAGQINDNDCNDTSGNFVDYGELSSEQTYTTSSQIFARTNADHGYTIRVLGQTMTSGVNSIPLLDEPTESLVGIGQFGMNIAVNTNPNIGEPPSGSAANVAFSDDYMQPNKFLLREGDIIASSDGVTLPKKFTANYIVNISKNQQPGIYSTTVSYLCLASF